MPTELTLKEEMLEALRLQHDALDALMARLSDAKTGFMPSKSGRIWEAVQAGYKAIQRAEREP